MAARSPSDRIVRLMDSALPVLFALLVLASCASHEQHDYTSLVSPTRRLSASAYRQSIHHSDFTADPLVANGDCYEQLQIAIPESIKTLSLPPGTITKKCEGRFLVGHLKKTLSWAGHPGNSKTSIDDVRLKMGVAMKITGRTLFITTFGTWSSFEGGSDVTMLAAIPAGLSIRHTKDQPANRTADDLTQNGWFVVPSYPALKKEYDRFTNDN